MPVIDNPSVSTTTDPYEADDDHAGEELALVRACIERMAAGRRARGEGAAAAASPLDFRDLVEVTRRIEGRVRASRLAGRLLPFDRLRRTFGLTPTEQRVVWVLAALELDTATRELAQYVVGDPGRPVADLGFLGHAAYGNSNRSGVGKPGSSRSVVSS